MSKHGKIVTQGLRMNVYNGFERRMSTEDVALNTESKVDNGSERQTGKR